MEVLNLENIVSYLREEKCVIKIVHNRFTSQDAVAISMISVKLLYCCTV